MNMESDYWNALDKAKELRVDPSQIGISHGVGDVGEGLKANVFRGAKVVELGFMGQQKGFRSQPSGHTPETYGTREREEMREMAKINEVEVSTHASPNIGFVAGYQEGAFRPELREHVLHEVERAVDFAADVGRGGPVVMHLGEFPRPLFQLQKNEYGEPLFEAFDKGEEARRAPIYVVDERTGRVQGIERNTPITVPKSAKPNEDPWKNPKRDPKTGMIEFETKTIADFEKEAYDKGEKDISKYIFDKLIKRDIELAQGEQKRFLSAGEEYGHAAKEIDEQIKDIEEFRKGDAELARLKAIRLAESLRLAPSERSSTYEKFLQDPFEHLHQKQEDLRRQSEGFHGMARSAGAQAHTLQENVKSMVPIEEYGLKESARTIARAAMNALEQERAKKLDKPLWIAPENWTPEQYGSHPDEYRKIIVESRNAMARELQKKEGIDADEAKRIAKEHIRGTFDIGHANFWYKYFTGNKKEFDRWMEKEVDKLTKDGIIGHVHLSDNFGYHDEHLSPGEGNAPIQRFVERLKEKGYAGKFIGEPGGQKEGRYHHALTESWRHLGSPIYRIDSTSQSWTDIESSYFGRAPQPPNFIVGDYAPSKDWTLWSEVPLE